MSMGMVLTTVGIHIPRLEELEIISWAVLHLFTTREVNSQEELGVLAWALATWVW